MVLAQGFPQTVLANTLPPDLYARLLDLTGRAGRGDAAQERLLPVVTICFNRYAVEDVVHRLTLDLEVRTDTGKSYPAHVLEQKSTRRDSAAIVTCPLRPIKLSKFLWATT